MAVTTLEKQSIETIFTGECIHQNVCPVKDIMAAYGDKWTMYTILQLGKNQRMRFNELRTSVNGISQRMLTVTLRSLEADGIVCRTLYAEIPPRVEYCLTELGESLLRQLLKLANWAENNFAEIMLNREKFLEKAGRK